MRLTSARVRTSEKHAQKWGATSLRACRLTRNRRVRHIVGRQIAPPRPSIRLVRTRPRGARTSAQLLERLIRRGSQRRRQAGAHLLRQHGDGLRHRRHMTRRVKTSREPVQKPPAPLQRPAQVGKRDRGRQITTNARRQPMRQQMTLRSLVLSPRPARSVRRKIRRKRLCGRTFYRSAASTTLVTSFRQVMSENLNLLERGASIAPGSLQR